MGIPVSVGSRSAPMGPHYDAHFFSSSECWLEFRPEFHFGAELPSAIAIVARAHAVEHALRSEKVNRPVSASIDRKVREDFSHNTRKLEAMPRARRGKNNLRRFRMLSEDEVLVWTAGIDAKAGAVDLACRRGDIALEERRDPPLMIGNIRSRRICRFEISPLR